MNTHKTCNKCDKSLPIESFGRAMSPSNVRYTPAQEFHKTCKPCKAATHKTWRASTGKQYMNPKRVGLLKGVADKDKKLVSIIRLRLRDAKERIRKYNQIESNIDVDFLLQLYKNQGGKCAYLGTRLSLEKKQNKSISLDKIEPSLGYIKGNVQWVCWVVNRAKGDMTNEHFFAMCQRVTERCNDYRNPTQVEEVE